MANANLKCLENSLIRTQSQLFAILPVDCSSRTNSGGCFVMSTVDGSVALASTIDHELNPRHKLVENLLTDRAGG